MEKVGSFLVMVMIVGFGVVLVFQLDALEGLFR